MIGGGQSGGQGRVLLDAFEMAGELPVIKFFAVTVTVSDFVILIDGVKCDYFTFMESSAGKPFTDDRTILKNSSVWCCVGHSLNLWGDHPLSLLGGGS